MISKSGWELQDDHHIAGRYYLFCGIYIYAKSTKAINTQGIWGLWIMTGFFVLANAYNLFGPPPEDNVMVLFVSFVVLQVIVLGLAWWVDKNREKNEVEKFYFFLLLGRINFCHKT